MEINKYKDSTVYTTEYRRNPTVKPFLGIFSTNMFQVQQ